MFKFIKLLFFSILLLACGKSISAQTLWGINLADFSTPTGWKLSEGIYKNTAPNEANFDGILFIPTVGYVFYYENAEAGNLRDVYKYLNEKLGHEKLNKDFISKSVREPEGDKLTEAVNNGKATFYRVWEEDGFRIRLFWNQYRFWVEAYKIDKA